MGNRLKALRLERSWTHEKAAEKMGVSRSQYIKLERGERRLTEQYIDQAANAFGVSPAEIIAEHSGGVVPKVGYVGAGQIVVPFEADESEYVEAPPDAMAGTVAVEVRGESMLPAYEDGWLIYYSRRLPPDEMLNKRAVVQLADGRILVKTVRRGSTPGYWNLGSLNAYDIEDQVIEWAAPIDWIKPR
jgi:transcriptional regulator with XRE-family HTH domain